MCVAGCSIDMELMREFGRCSGPRSTGRAMAGRRKLGRGGVVEFGVRVVGGER